MLYLNNFSKTTFVVFLTLSGLKLFEDNRKGLHTWCITEQGYVGMRQDREDAVLMSNMQ